MKRAEIVRKSDEYGRGCDRECYRKYPREYDRKYESEEAVSTVVAVMLILAILATCISVYTSTYVPGLKQQAEIMHSQSVEQAFLRFASGVDNIYGQKKSAKFSEPVVLGGGDVLLSSVKSGGMIEIHTDSKNGPVIGALRVSGTGGWQNWEEVSGDVNVSGTEDLYIVFKGDSGYLLNVDWWKFS
ncbi:MAG: carbohydrate-binding protein, partial [Methanomicrobium sp.]|nr:carbohydrate-binding protein [Methanomicrobium sp.]